MRLPKYDPPTNTFRHKISRRLNMLSVPKRHLVQTDEGMPAFTVFGIRRSALRSQITDRVNDAAWPYLRRMLILKRQYKNRFPPERLERIDRIIELANSTAYSKLANCTIVIKKGDTKDVKRKKGWSESEWKKRMDSINQMAAPKKDFRPPPPYRGVRKPLSELQGRIKILASLPDFKMHKRLSQEAWYRDPIKVPPNALKYVISERIKKLAAPRVIQQM